MDAADERSPPSVGPRRTKLIVAGVVGALTAIAFLVGFFFHHARQRAIEEAAERAKTALPVVSAAAVRRSRTSSQLLLPGSITPIVEANLFARASGYLRRRYVDIGDWVRKDQILADIDSPELDQQVAQANAALAQARQQLAQANTTVADARAKVELARVTWVRYRVLLAQDSVARQDADQRQQEFQSAQAALLASVASVRAAEENVRAAAANLLRLKALQDFERLRAPFDGVVTARNVDVGTLIAGSGGNPAATLSSSSNSEGSGPSSPSSVSMPSGTGGQGSELFRVAQVDRLRILISVPQSNAAAISIDTPASVFVQEFPQPFTGKVTRTANALDPASRTLLTEVQLQNPQRVLLPGMYAQVQFDSPRGNPPLLVPGSSLISRANGTQLAVLLPLTAQERERVRRSPDAQQARRIHLQQVAIGRDYGTEIEITEGLRGDDWVVANPGDAVQEGAIVVPRMATAGEEQQGAEKPGGQSEKLPAGITSPGMPAPAQGPVQKGGGRRAPAKEGTGGERKP